MPRPQKEGLDYFPHDTDACSDEKVEALRILYGNDGYAFYFILLERIYRTAEGELEVSDAETIQILCRKIEVTEKCFKDMLETALKRGVFCRESYDQKGVLTSNGIRKRISPVIRKRLKMKEYYESKIVSDAETLPETEQKPCIVKESKEEKSKEKKRKELKKNIKKKKTIVPEEWEPSNRVLLWAVDHEILNLREKIGPFIDYHRSKGSLFLDFDAAFRTWLRNSKSFEQDKKIEPKTEAELFYEREKRNQGHA